MNHPLVRWLLDLETIPADATGLRIAWEHPWAGWLWALLLIAAVLLAGWAYRRLAGRRPIRIALGIARFFVITLALVLLAGPMIELPRESVEPDWVLVLADRSASMAIGDALDDAGGQRSRDDQLHDVVVDHQAMWTTLAEKRQVRWLGFHSGVFNLQSPGVEPLDLGAASGRRTNLNAALEQALQRAAARPVSGIVILSDGRTTNPPDRAIMRRLQAEAVPVFTVPLGSPDPVGDLALRRVDAPRRAFVRDKVPVIVELDQFGAAAAGGTIILVDEETGETLDEVTITADQTGERVTLTAEPSLAGEANWAIQLETDRPDLIPENNRKAFTIELVERPLRVLYVDGYPRWEYRYLKNLLVREQSIESSVMLLSADRDFAQEGNQPITRLPRSPEEMARYDVVVLGDVPASFFSPDQLEMIRQHVAERGAGLLWIGGQRHTPRSYAGTALADLLPMRGGLELPTMGMPVNVAPTPLAERLGVLRLVTREDIGWPSELIDPRHTWSQLYSAQHIEPARLKPTAEVLAHTVQMVDGEHLPLVMMLRYGAGQTIYTATDEIWRWRYGRGELLPEQFWIQMIRMLGRESLSTAGQRAVLSVAPRRVQVGQPVRVDLHLLDALLIENAPASVAAAVETADGEKISDIELRRLPDNETRFGATFLPGRTGTLRIRVKDRSVPDLDLVTGLEVFGPDDELRRPETDHALLRQIAESTGGRVLSPDDVARLPEWLPNREVRTKNPLRERLWDTPLAFGLVLILLTMEWVGRKVLRLV